jgi:hypothetical protein
LQEAKKANRYLSENGNNGSKPHTPAPLQADCDEIFDTAKVLLATLGYSVFDPVLSPEEATDGTQYFCSKNGANAEGKYTAEGFVVMRGSKGRGAVSDSFENTHTCGQLRRELLHQGKVTVTQGELVFQENVLFKSPSAGPQPWLPAVQAAAGKSGILETAVHWRNWSVGSS